MPIIEYIHSTKTYRITVAKTVEWSKRPYARDEAYAPFLGIGQDGKYDYSEVFTFPEHEKEKAFARMTEHWNAWRNAGFPAVVHA